MHANDLREPCRVAFAALVIGLSGLQVAKRSPNRPPPPTPTISRYVARVWPLHKTAALPRARLRPRRACGPPEFDTNYRKSLIRISQAFGIVTAAGSIGSRWRAC